MKHVAMLQGPHPHPPRKAGREMISIVAERGIGSGCRVSYDCRFVFGRNSVSGHNACRFPPHPMGRVRVGPLIVGIPSVSSPAAHRTGKGI